MHETSDFLLYNNIFIYQVLCTLVYRRRSLYSFLLFIIHVSTINQNCDCEFEEKIGGMETMTPYLDFSFMAIVLPWPLNNANFGCVCEIENGNIHNMR